jgi:Tfp pilus assembly protein PilF
LTKRAATAVLFLLAAVLCLAQEPGKLEGEAKRAFDSGRFQEAGEKYAKAAEEPNLAADRKSDLYFQSAWAYFIGGNSRTARENLKAAFSARPNMEIAAEPSGPKWPAPGPRRPTSRS